MEGSKLLSLGQCFERFGGVTEPGWLRRITVRRIEALLSDIAFVEPKGTYEASDTVTSVTIKIFARGTSPSKAEVTFRRTGTNQMRLDLRKRGDAWVVENISCTSEIYGLLEPVMQVRHHSTLYPDPSLNEPPTVEARRTKS